MRGCWRPWSAPPCTRSWTSDSSSRPSSPSSSAWPPSSRTSGTESATPGAGLLSSSAMIPAAFLLLASAWSINHQPLDCFVKDRFAQLEIEVKPALDVTSVRAFFKSARDEQYYYVQMALTQGRFTAKLPRPREKAQSITYYIEITGADGTVRKTPEITGQVAKSADACPSGSRIADAGPDGDVRVWTSGASRSKPKDFAGVDKVMREGDAVGETAAAAPAGTDTPPVPTPAVPLPPPAPPAPTPTPLPRSILDQGLRYALGAEDIVRVTDVGNEDLTQ